MVFVIIYFWVAFSVLVGMLARQNGRDLSVGVLTALLLSPLVALALYLVIGKTRDRKYALIRLDEAMREQARSEIADKIRAGD